MRARRFVAIGASQGGATCLATILAGLPAGYGVPTALVQHRGAQSDDTLVRYLQRHTTLTVLEVVDKQPLLPGHLFVAPADYHLLLDGGHFALSVEDLVSHARPSIDVFFESVADAVGASAVGLVLTGANADGARGLARIKANGGLAVVQDPRTAEAARMPRAALEACAADFVAGPAEIGKLLGDLCGAPP